MRFRQSIPATFAIGSILGLVVFLVIGIGASAFAKMPAERAGLKVLDVVCDEPLLTQIESVLIISDAQRAETRRAFENYWSQVLEIDARGWEQGLDAGWREIEQIGEEARKAAAHPRNPDGSMPIIAVLARQDQRMSELREGYERAWLTARVAADSAFEAWLERLRSVGVIDADSEPRLRRLVLRANMDDRGSTIADDCHRIPDPIILLDKASVDGGEFHDLRRLQRVEDELDVIIMAYETALDAWLQRRLAERRRMPNRHEPSSISSQDPGWREFQKRQGDKWGQRYDVSRRTADAIAALARNHGFEEAAVNWEARFLKAFCPELMKDRLPERLPEWLAQRADATPEQLAAAEAWLAGWLLERERLRQRAISAGVIGKRQIEWLVSRQPLALAYADRLYDIHEGAHRAVTSFLAILNFEQRETLAPEIAALNVKRADARLGPPIEPDALQGVLEGRK